MNLCQTGGRKEARFKKGGGDDRPRPRWRSVRGLPPPPSAFREIPTLSVHARSREALLRKTRASPSWPR
jgi:hypothetical protein